MSEEILEGGTLEPENGEDEVPKSTGSFQIRFQGPAVDSGVMDVKQLAPALLAVGELCERANVVLNGDARRASVRVRSEFQAGSFVVELVLVQTSWRYALDIISLTSDSLKDAQTILAALGLGGGGFFYWWKRNKGKALPENREEVPPAIKLEMENTKLEISESALKLMSDPGMIKIAREVIKPIAVAGLSRMQLVSTDTKVVTEGEAITSDEAREILQEPMATDQPTEILQPSTSVQAFTLENVNFRTGLKWRLKNSDTNIRATMEDQNFLEETKSGQRYFRAGDVLVMKIETRTFQDSQGNIKAEHAIKEVVEHRHASRQSSLFGDEFKLPFEGSPD